LAGGGAHPQDRELFAPSHVRTLQTAADELRYLRERGYALPGALKLVGDRHQLLARQRLAIRRATSEAEGAAARAPRRLAVGAPPPPALHIDGFNVVITGETALHGGVLVTTLDRGLRDLAGVHGTYRVTDVTERVLELTAGHLDQRGWAEVPTRWLLDQPVSNSGRLATLIRAWAEERGLPWTVEVVADPDQDLKQLPPAEVAASGDAAVLDACGPWVDLGSEVVLGRVPEAWVVDVIPAARP
jgi:hypothetical protein